MLPENEWKKPKNYCEVQTGLPAKLLQRPVIKILIILALYLRKHKDAAQEIIDLEKGMNNLTVSGNIFKFPFYIGYFL